MPEIPQVVFKLVEGKYNLYLVAKIGSPITAGDRYLAIVRCVSDASEIVKQLNIPAGDWPALRKAIDEEFGLEVEIEEGEIEDE